MIRTFSLWWYSNFKNIRFCATGMFLPEWGFSLPADEKQTPFAPQQPSVDAILYNIIVFRMCWDFLPTGVYIYKFLQILAYLVYTLVVCSCRSSWKKNLTVSWCHYGFRHQAKGPKKCQLTVFFFRSKVEAERKKDSKSNKYDTIQHKITAWYRSAQI